MNFQTKIKLDKMLKEIDNGSTEKDIIKYYFNRSKKAYTDWIMKYEIELNFKSTQIVTKESMGLNVPSGLIKEVQNHGMDIKSILERLDNIEKHGNVNNENVEINDLLHISDDILKLKSVVKSIRINSDLVDQFNAISENHLNFSKTNLWNHMLKEFVEKYK